MDLWRAIVPHVNCDERGSDGGRRALRDVHRYRDGRQAHAQSHQQAPCLRGIFLRAEQPLRRGHPVCSQWREASQQCSCLVTSGCPQHVSLSLTHSSRATVQGSSARAARTHLACFGVRIQVLLKFTSQIWSEYEHLNVVLKLGFVLQMPATLHGIRLIEP